MHPESGVFSNEFNCTNNSDIPDISSEVAQLYTISYSYFLPGLTIIGIIGNILNLCTLQSNLMRNTRFIYLRAVGIVDFLALILVFISSFGFTKKIPSWYEIIVYRTYMEIALINTFLTASVFIALVFTIERYVMIAHPHRRVQAQQTPKALRSICLATVLALLLHIPMVLVQEVKYDVCSNSYVSIEKQFRADSPALSTLYYVYELIREIFVRAVTVILLIFFNVLILRSVKQNKRKRSEMTLRKVTSVPHNLPLNGRSRRNSRTRLLKLSEDKRLTVLVITLTFLYAVGITPQIPLMVTHISRDSEQQFEFQVFRAIVNLLEITTHCLHFYVFCLSSSDYRRSFITIFCNLCFLITRRRAGRRQSADSSSSLMTETPEQFVTERSSLMHSDTEVENGSGLAYL